MGSMLDRKNPKQQYLKVVTLRSVMFHSAKSALMFSTKQPTYYTEETIQCMRESFNIIRQKQLGLFVLGVTHISNLPTVCVKLTKVGGWVQHSDCLMLATIWHMKYQFLLKSFLIFRKKCQQPEYCNCNGKRSENRFNIA